MNDPVCRLCNTRSSDVIYDGPIRNGGVISGTIDGYSVHRCAKCGFVFLDPIPDKLDEFYETEEYRLRFDYQIDVSNMQQKYDHEQNARISRIGIQNLRNKVVADFGAGPGLFLDAAQGAAKRTIAVEPSRLYQKYFESRGHTFYSYPEELLAASEKVDVAVSFDTIEHILNVHEFAKQIYDALVDGGTFYLSMPNHRDMVRLTCPETFEPFFYQVSHLNYFDEDSTLSVLEAAGFRDISIGYLHKYTIDNLLQWQRNGKPGILDTGGTFDIHFHNVYRAEIERLGIASHLFAVARK